MLRDASPGPPGEGSGSIARPRPASGLYVMLTNGRARPGEEDAIVALHEDWVRRRSADAGMLSSEILVDPDDPCAFMAISHFVDQAAAESSLRDPEHSAWRFRLASLSEVSIVRRDMVSVWRATELPASAPTQRAHRRGSSDED